MITPRGVLPPTRRLAIGLVHRLPAPVKARLKPLARRSKDRLWHASRTRVGGAVLSATGILRRATAEPFEELAPTLPRSLTTDDGWYRYPVAGPARLLLTVETAEQLDPEARAGVLRYRYIDRWGRRAAEPVGHSKAVDGRHGPHDWIPRVPRGTTSTYVILAPSNVVAVDIRLAPTGATEVTVNKVSVEPLGPRTELDPFDVPTGLPPRRELRIALIADTFTVTALRLEAHVCCLSADRWREELASFRPDVLFVESCFNGNDGAWLYRIAKLEPDDTELRELVGHARSLGIPVLFWNKEDPAHYDDFIEAARLCDVVATTDSAMIPRYRSDLGHDAVQALPFCIQADIHNPRRAAGSSGERVEAAAFLGSWWAEKFDARRHAQEQLFEGARAYGLEVFDRYLTWDAHERYRMAPEWLRYVHGTLDYDQALTAYRHYAVLLNVNTVTDSATMFSRRALEASACGAAVVTNPSEGTTAALGDLAVPAATAEECREALAGFAADPGGRERLAHRAYRHTHRNHSWANRLDDVARACNLALPSRARPKISAVLATKRRDGADRIVRYLASIDDPAFELEPIVITAFDPGELEAQAELEASGAVVLQERAGETLGDCLNRGAEVATGGLIAKVDDDDVYGPNYFGDLLLAIDHSRADIVGKACHYQYLEANDTTVLRYPGREHRFTRFVCGSTLLAKASVYEQARFPSQRVGEDTEFLRRVLAAGLRLYSADRFGYVSMRRADLDSHTWREEHDTILSSSQTKEWCRGLPDEDVEV